MTSDLRLCVGGTLDQNVDGRARASAISRVGNSQDLAGRGLLVSWKIGHAVAMRADLEDASAGWTVAALDPPELVNPDWLQRWQLRDQHSCAIACAQDRGATAVALKCGQQRLRISHLLLGLLQRNLRLRKLPAGLDELRPSDRSGQYRHCGDTAQAQYP